MRRCFTRVIAKWGILVALSSCGIPIAIIGNVRRALIPDTIVVQQVGSDASQAPSNNPGVNGQYLSQTVGRVVCPSKNSQGTGFIHKSSGVLTALHVVTGCPISDLHIILADGSDIGVTNATWNPSLDIAYLVPKTSMAGRRVVNLSRSDTVDVGEQITFWGFPAGHNGNEPLFTAGYVSGSDNKAVYPDGNELKPFGSTLLVLNAGVNPGNSGSPVIRVSEGSIIGMVIRKSVPSTDIGYIVPSAAIAAFLRGINIDP